MGLPQTWFISHPRWDCLSLRPLTAHGRDTHVVVLWEDFSHSCRGVPPPQPQPPMWWKWPPCAATFTKAQETVCSHMHSGGSLKNISVRTRRRMRRSDELANTKDNVLRFGWEVVHGWHRSSQPISGYCADRGWWRSYAHGRVALTPDVQQSSHFIQKQTVPLFCCSLYPHRGAAYILTLAKDAKMRMELVEMPEERMQLCQGHKWLTGFQDCPPAKKNQTNKPKQKKKP